MLTLIAAIAENSCIGRDGALPWHLPEDMARFRARTQGAVVLMGRTTWESLPERFRPLPHRTNAVVTRQHHYAVPSGVFVYPSVDAALHAHRGDDVYVIGGAQIFAQTIDRADRLEITHVHRTVSGGDAFFPIFDQCAWTETAREDHDGYSFVTYERVPILHSIRASVPH